jgi:hypothetical protein
MRSRVRASGFVLALLLTVPTAVRADVALDWNLIAIRTTNGQNPFFQARFVAITQLAVFEAVNAVNGGYQSYLDPPIAANSDASADAAVIAAAHRVLVTYFPGSAAVLDADRAASLAAIRDGAAKDAGIAIGEAAAQAMIALRTGDGSAPKPLYVPTSALPGEWQLTPTPAGAPPCVGGLFTQWPTLKPFGIANATDFMPGPPPELSSNQYAKDYAEVKRVGDINSVARPTDRADVARYYASASPSYVLNMAARQLSTARGDSLSENARALAILNMAISDGLVVSFAAKYHYLYWRPVTAIRLGDTDGNPKTQVDPVFTPYIATPCFPSYPSNHASGTNSGLEILRRVYGAAGHWLSLPHHTLAMTMSYTSLEQISDDVDDARVYGGIHYRFDQEAGGRLGREVATYVYKHNLRKTNTP